MRNLIIYKIEKRTIRRLILLPVVVVDDIISFSFSIEIVNDLLMEDKMAPSIHFYTWCH